MTVIYIVAILLEAAVIVYFVRRGRKQPKKQVATQEPDDTYEGQRNLAISITPSQLKLNIPDDKTFVYGVVMDWNTGDSIMTLASYITGAANLYFSKGGGVKGAGINPSVGEAAVKFVDSAQGYIASALPAAVSDTPAENCVRFYLLTNKQLYVAQEQVKHMDDNSSAWLPLFKKGNEVIAEMMN